MIELLLLPARRSAQHELNSGDGPDDRAEHEADEQAGQEDDHGYNPAKLTC